MNSGKFLRISV